MYSGSMNKQLISAIRWEHPEQKIAAGILAMFVSDITEGNMDEKFLAGEWCALLCSVVGVGYAEFVRLSRRVHFETQQRQRR